MTRPTLENESSTDSVRVLWISTFAFTLLFAVWLMLGVLGLPIREEFQLSPSQFDWLLATAIMAGSLPRLHFGIWADRYGGRLMMTLTLLGTAVPTFLLSQATSYTELLLCAIGFGLAGNSFTVGIAWNSAWFPAHRKGAALGVYGAGNVGASLTKFLAPTLMASLPTAGMLFGWIPGGWRFLPVLYTALLIGTSALVWWGTPSPDRCPGRGRPLSELMAPLRHSRVWRFGLYYVVVFGAYVALAAFLPKYYVDVYGLSLSQAAYLTALFIFPASLLRPLGGWLADLYGPRVVTYSVFVIMTVCFSLLSIPSTMLQLNAAVFTVLIFVAGCGMGIGKASVFKYVPDYFPNDVGPVGGLVGLLGAVGGFALPLAFGYLERWGGSPQYAFLALLILCLVSLAWLHVVVRSIRIESKRAELVPAGVS